MERQDNLKIVDLVSVESYSASMDVKGCKPGQASSITDHNVISGGDVGFGERLSICGQFAISKQGAWRALEPSQQITTKPAMEGMDATGKHVSVWSVGELAGMENESLFWCLALTVVQGGVHAAILHYAFMQTAGQLKLSKMNSTKYGAANNFRQHGTLHLK